LLGIDGVGRVHAFQGLAVVMMTGGKTLAEPAVAAALTATKARLELKAMTRNDGP
jgi:hypothetical protein